MPRAMKVMKAPKAMKAAAMKAVVMKAAAKAPVMKAGKGAVPEGAWAKAKAQANKKCPKDPAEANKLAKRLYGAMRRKAKAGK